MRHLVAIDLQRRRMNSATSKPFRNRVRNAINYENEIGSRLVDINPKNKLILICKFFVRIIARHDYDKPEHMGSTPPATGFILILMSCPFSNAEQRRYPTHGIVRVNCK